MAAGSQLDKSTPNPAGDGAGGLPRRPAPRWLGPLSGSWEKGSARWQLLPPRQRSWVLIGAGLLAATVAATVWYAARTDWRTLYAGLDPEDTRQMAQVLTQAQIPFDLSANGTALRVPAESLDKARLATAAKGGPR